jgi:hypothetical protein
MVAGKEKRKAQQISRLFNNKPAGLIISFGWKTMEI